MGAARSTGVVCRSSSPPTASARSGLLFRQLDRQAGAAGGTHAQSSPGSAGVAAVVAVPAGRGRGSGSAIAAQCTCLLRARRRCGPVRRCGHQPGMRRPSGPRRPAGWCCPGRSARRAGGRCLRQPRAPAAPGDAQRGPALRGGGGGWAGGDSVALVAVPAAGSSKLAGAGQRCSCSGPRGGGCAQSRLLWLQVLLVRAYGESAGCCPADDGHPVSGSVRCREVPARSGSRARRQRCAASECEGAPARTAGLPPGSQM